MQDNERSAETTKVVFPKVVQEAMRVCGIQITIEYFSRPNIYSLITFKSFEQSFITIMYICKWTVGSVSGTDAYLVVDSKLKSHLQIF